MSAHLNRLEDHAREALEPAIRGQLSPSERIALYKRFLKIEEHRIKLRHRAGAGGLEVARARAALIDTVLSSILASALNARNGNVPPIALVATGGYGRGTLNPSSDIDILFLLPRASTKLPKALQELVQEILYLLWDVGFKVGHACRSINECIQEAKADQENKTALMDARLVDGDRPLFEKFQEGFDRDCIQKNQDAFFDLRRQDLRNRHQKYSRTVFLQEPNVKEGCGSLRDYQNILWVARVKRGDSDLKKLAADRIITANTLRELEAAYDFLHRVRNELHYHTKRATDMLTLQLQGVVATSFQYPQRSILRRTEAFMRDYYRHTRHIYQHTGSLMETFQIEQEDLAENGFRSFLTFRKKDREKFDGFIARDGRIYPANNDIFKEDIHRMMRLFQHCQVRNLRLSPQIRRLVAAHWSDIDRPFCYSKTNRQVFQGILERKGEVAHTLRLMHRIGFLGRYIPEFGALDCLVQHEFFHRYTADEHTLRCIEQLDQLLDETRPQRQIYRRLFLDIVDPYALYLAVILHDTGRAENVREHIDGSAILAARLCNRMQIQGARRTRIMFLVDNHLIFYRTATSKNIYDPEVIAEFAGIMKNNDNLDALFLFTFADSNGTSPDSWNGWKESLILQLYKSTKTFLENGREKYSKKLDTDRRALRDEVLKLMREDYQQEVKQHFERMPTAAFNFRQAPEVVTQVRTVRHFIRQEKEKTNPYAFCIKWIDHPERGYSEIVLAARDKPLHLEKTCCALASEEINILSADLFTRTDGIVLNIFRVCTTNFEPVSDAKIRKRLDTTFKSILSADEYEPEKFLRRRNNFLKARTDQGIIPVPVRALISNELHPSCTTVEIQALDRIGLLHDLFHAINQYDFNTTHARICTEKGVAMDTLYITTEDGKKIVDPVVIEKLTADLNELVVRPETPA
ncbi:[protein-PII] uridylyltransferase [Luteolibacter pohnpeiensis]|uniref:Bifunctional uridylyltransferase/uridylyl-removing enzyme n=1 Tax=Luteolibacter pohnpeiensis TaxID=454153 RepID=A0A934SAH4_9BACT|nr:[protein-PII] uridylyltransferase [Luteolibacter pohnpeiensis]MBK1881778.1 [protein-PII] uridylyltransferase [Luteolibacter pohnpeiensis]